MLLPGAAGWTRASLLAGLSVSSIIGDALHAASAIDTSVIMDMAVSLFNLDVCSIYRSILDIYPLILIRIVRVRSF